MKACLKYSNFIFFFWINWFWSYGDNFYYYSFIIIAIIYDLIPTFDMILK